MPWIGAIASLFGVGGNEPQQQIQAPVQQPMNPLLIAALAIGVAGVIGGGTYLVLRK